MREAGQLIGAGWVDHGGVLVVVAVLIEGKPPLEPGTAAVKRRAIRVLALLDGTEGGHAEGACIIRPVAQSAHLRRRATVTGVLEGFGAEGELVTRFQGLDGLDIDRAAKTAGRHPDPAPICTPAGPIPPRTPGSRSRRSATGR